MEDLDKEGLKDVMAKAYADTAFAGKILFPERFYRPYSSLHDKIFEVIDRRPGDPNYKPRKCIIVPRGLGKTSISNLLVPAKKALFQESRYIVPVSCSATLAEQQSENLKNKLIHNQRIRKLFGDLTTKKLNKQQWVINVGGEKDGKKVCIMPRGAGQQIRGLLYEDFRPDLFVVDDLEDPENMDSADQRKKKKDWFFGDLMQAVDNYADEGAWEIIVVGTVLHQDSLVVGLAENSDWDTLELAICDEQFNPLAPEWASQEWIKNKYNELKNADQVDTFYREYMNMPTAGGSDAIFQKSFFRYYDPTKKLLRNSDHIENLIIVDIARTAKTSSSDSAIVGLAVDLRTQAIYVRDIVKGKFHPDEIYNEIFKMEKRIEAKVLAVEVTGLHEFVVYPLKNEMAKRSSRMELIELQARGGANEKGKVSRIRALVPFYRQGLVYHNPSIAHIIETQLMSFPKAKMWDVMDALAYVVELLEKGERYMYRKAYEEYEEADDVEAEFRELEGEFEKPLDTFRALEFEDFR